MKRCSPAGNCALQEVNHLLRVLLGPVVKIDALYEKKHEHTNRLNPDDLHSFTPFSEEKWMQDAKHTHTKAEERS